MVCETPEPPVAIIAPVLEPTAKELVESRLKSEAWERIDRIDEAIQSYPQLDLPLTHTFTKGLYTRTIYMPAGAGITTRIHLTEHPFLLSKGVVSVWSGEGGWVKISAPHLGITTPGTRRVLFIHEDAVWSTFHVTDETDPDKIALQMTYSEGKFSELGIAAATKELK
jgi:hypothetical protein